MSFTATVENDIIKLPPEIHLPNGTQVIIEPMKQTCLAEADAASLYESLHEFIGCIDTGLGDLAENHDHYLYGTQKRRE